MPETPDFQRIAARVITDLEAITGDPPAPMTALAETRRELADIATLEAVLPSLTTVKLGALKTIDTAIRTLDR